MKALKQTASKYLGYCVLIGDIINHTNNISLWGQKKQLRKITSEKYKQFI